MAAHRQIVFSEGDEFLSAQGVIYDASTWTYVRLRRTDSLSFMGSERLTSSGTEHKLYATLGTLTLSWLPSEQPDLRQQLTDWWLNRKDPK